jgi:ubiquinone/menaquinone biosynthesis C-methylase UbiE
MAGDVNESVTVLEDSCIFDQLMGDVLRPGGIRLTAKIAEIAGIKKQYTILDVGCGKGSTAAFLAREYDVRIIGIDLSSIMVSSCRSKTDKEEMDQRISFLVGDGENLPFRDSSFDAVIIESAFSLFPDKALAVRDICRVLKSNGRLIISDFILKGTVDRELQKQINFPCCLSGALRFEEFIQLFELAGFKSHYIEDRSDELKKVGFQFYMYINSTENISELRPAGPCRIKGRNNSAVSLELLQEFFQLSKPGYVLMVMTKI